MKQITTLSFLLISSTGFCCTTCNKRIREMIYDSTFFPNLLSMLSPFIILAIIVMVLSHLSARRFKARSANWPHLPSPNPVPLTTAAMVLGIGLGSFIDGIVLHQILQWHEMLTNKLAPLTVEAKSVNMFWDGIFHAFTFIVVLIGVVLLWKLLQRENIMRCGRLFAGGMLVGWGIFNIVEGVINHHILHLHNVRETVEPELWNYGFLGASLIMIIMGYLMIRSRTRINHPPIIQPD